MNSCRLHFILRNNSIMKHFTPFILLALLTAFSAQAKHPNILFIIADDQSPFDFKAYNPSSPLDAPAIGKLAAQGMTFDQAYHVGSIPITRSIFIIALKNRDIINI